MNCQRYYDKAGATGKNQRETARFEQTFPFVHSEGTLLDAGCGEGYWLDFLRERTKLKLSGLDISPVRLDIAKKNLRGSDISLCIADIQNLPHERDSVDQVTALEVLEHIPDWKSGLHHLVRVARRRAVVSVPYNEKLKYEICGNCGEQAFLYGHLHSFTENDFEGRGIDGEIVIKKLASVFGLGHYARRAVRKVMNTAKALTAASENGHSLYTICPKCYAEVPYKKYAERTIQRAMRIITRQPEYLIIQINK